MTNRKIFIILFILIITSTVFFLIYGKKDTNEPELKKQALYSAQRGWQWLYNYKGNFLDPGIPRIIKTINNKYCGSKPEIESFWKKILKEFEDHSYLSVFERFFIDDSNYQINDKVIEILQTPQEDYNDVLAQALYCNLYPVRADFAEKTFDGIEKETRYDLTHKFWSAILFKSNECAIKNYNIDNIISVAAQKIYEEQKKSNFDDLYAERTAFLMEYGFKNIVPEDWIKNIIANQNESGAWGTPTYFSKNFENPHTTALAIWSLVQYSQTCPF